jgi:hypothetical protein
MKLPRRTALAGALATGLVVAALATTAGSPAVADAPPAPADPTVIFNENFEHGLTSTPVKLVDYSGTNGQTYTGSHYWTQEDCNGNIMTNNANDADLGLTTCGNAGSFDAVKTLSAALGQLPGGPADANDNHAVTAYTNNITASGTEFETVGQIPVSAANRFVTFSVGIAVINCNVAHPQLEYYLKDAGGNLTPLFSTPNDPCDASATFGGARYGTFAGNKAVLLNQSSVGLLFNNLTTNFNGNDFAFDNIRLLDATPTLSKSFAPGAQAGGTDTLTFTVTNTTELAGKPGWSFTDNLPAGMTVAATPNVSSTCANDSVTPGAGSSSVHIGGDLSAGQSSCQVSVDVTAGGGSYANGAGNISDAIGLNKPTADARVRFNKPPTVDVAGPGNGATYFQGQQVSNSYTCADPDGSVASCVGTSPNGSPVDTSTPGAASLKVTATDNDGATAVKTVSYRIVPVVGVCRGTPLSLLGLSLNTANPATSPCATANPKPISANVVITPAIPLLGIAANQVSVTAIQGTTKSAPAGGAQAGASVADVTISLLGTTIKATGLTSSAVSQLTSCSAPATLTGISSIASLTINGKPVVNLNQPVSVPLLIGSLGLNERAVSGNTITQSALHLNVAGLVDLAIGQSVAGVTC